MRALTLCLVVIAACAAPSARAPLPAPAGTEAPDCRLNAADSQWLAAAIRGWQRVGEPRLRLSAGVPLPHLVLFDPSCTHDIDVAASWRVNSVPHGGRVRLPNGHVIPPIGVGITSPAANDSAIFLALALPESWRGDPRYRGTNDSRASWERYLVGAFTHEMTHARMLPGLLSRSLEAAIFPDTLEDNLVQRRFAAEREFARAVARETDLFYRAAQATSLRVRRDYVRAALGSVRLRREQYYIGDFADWAELEQTFLDLEGVAQWAAFGHEPGSATAGSAFPRALARFRSSREFWSEDEGLAMILALDALVPDWQSRLISATPTTSLDLLTQALGDDR
jgi:hypothetical protein